MYRLGQLKLFRQVLSKVCRTIYTPNTIEKPIDTDLYVDLTSQLRNIRDQGKAFEDVRTR